MLECLVDGEIASTVSAADRGLQFGDGIAETLAIVRGQPRFWQGHIDRIAAGCERLGLKTVPQAVLLRDVQTVAAGQGDCVVRIILTRRNAGPDYGYACDGGDTRRIVCSFARPAAEPLLPTLGLRARICDLRLAIQPELAGVNHLNRLEQVLARAEWSDERIGEGILLDREDFFGGRILTPRLDRCGIRGVMRAAVLAAFRERCEQRRIMIDMLPEADEVFLASAVDGIVPVTAIDHWEYAIGPVTREVQEWLAAQ